MEILSDLAADEVKNFAFGTYDYIVHFGSTAHTATIPEGDYYLKITDGTNTWYSEIITFRNFDPVDLY